MPTWDEFCLVQAQASIFTPNLQFRPGKVLAYFLGEQADLFSGQPIVLPTEAMPGFPQVILTSEDGRYRLQASSARLDLIWARQDPEDKVELRSFLDQATGFFAGYLELTRGMAGRLACILTRTAPDNTPSMTLARHFCQERWLVGPLNRPSDFELHAHKRFLLGETFQINSWFRCKTAIIQYGKPESGVRSDVILVEQDFNTLAEESETREYTGDEMVSFFRHSPAELDVVLRLYFPNEDGNA
jgi:hypothetical protein